MKNKIKLIDRLKSWLVTLGIASVFGLAALGFNAANSYQKVSAYEYQDNGNLVLNTNYNDFYMLYNYCLEYGTGTIDIYIDGDFLIPFTDDLETTYYIFYIGINSDNFTLEFRFSYNEDSYLLYYLGDGNFSVDDYESIDFSLPMFNITFTIDNFGSHYQSLRNYVLSYNAPQSSGNFVTALTSFMSLIGGGIVQLAQSVGAGVVSFASGLFLDSGHLSILGGIIGIFAGIALAVGITSKVYAWVTTLGN